MNDISADSGAVLWTVQEAIQCFYYAPDGSRSSLRMKSWLGVGGCFFLSRMPLQAQITFLLCFSHLVFSFLSHIRAGSFCGMWEQFKFSRHSSHKMKLRSESNDSPTSFQRPMTSS